MKEVWKGVEYNINEDTGVIICKLWDCKYLAVDIINKYLQLNLSKESEYLVSEAYVGIARCQPGEEFNVEYGKKLALNRAKEKRQTEVNNVVLECIEDIKRTVNNLEQNIRRKTDGRT